MALAGRVIASHYAEPLERRLRMAGPLLLDSNGEASVLAQLAQGDLFAMLDCSRGWAWGYGGPERLVGYVPAGAVAVA